MTITYMAYKVHIDDVLYGDPWCQSCMDSDCDISDADIEIEDVMADKEEVLVFGVQGNISYQQS
jgi:hypothetical protein